MSSGTDNGHAQDNRAFDPETSDSLETAFRAFNEVSGELARAYEALEARVARLTREAELADRERLAEVAEKERIASRMQNLLQLLPGGVVVLDRQGRVSECNPAARELLGEPLTGEDWRDVILQRFAPREDDGHEISLRDGRRVSLLTRSLDDEPGQIILVTDQTETRRLQQRLSRHERLSAMGRMVSSLAHQIRTPLSAAMLYVGHLSEGHLDETQTRRTLGKLSARLSNMERQVKDMLIFARGETVLDEQLEAGALLEQIRMASEVLLRSGPFICCWDDRAPDASLRCNQDSLIGALLNLVENALQSTGQSARLHIGAEYVDEQDRPVERPTSQLRLFVRDDGPGIEPQVLEQVTEPFFTTRARGTGLGLAVAQVVARAHGGRFVIDSVHEESRRASEETPGTCAGFILPVADMEQERKAV